MRSYEQLLSADPAWPALEAAARESGRVTILPRDAAASRSCLLRLGVTTHSTLGALAHETGGLLVDHGWLRLLGSGHERLRRALGAWNETLGIPVSEYLVVADDVIGGAFAINGAALGAPAGSVLHFAPDALAWTDLRLGYSAFVHWAIEGDLATFYENMRWPGWETETAQVGGDQAFSAFPPPWTKEGKVLANVSRRVVSAEEVWTLQQDLAQRLGSATRV